MIIIYRDFRADVLVELSDLEPEVLSKIAGAMDKYSTRYNFDKLSTDLVVNGRDRMQELVISYLITKKTEGSSQLTINCKADILKIFVKAMTKPIDEIKANDIRSFLYQYQQQRKVTNRTLDRVRSIVCAFINWCFAEGYIENNPAANVKPIKHTEKPRKALTQMELEIIRNTCKTDREKCIVEVLYSTGCRVSELCNIKIADIDFAKNEIQVLGKGNKYRTVYLNAKAILAIKKYLETRKHNSEYLLCNDLHGGEQMQRGIIEEMFRRFEKETGIRVTPHIMRHTMATQALTGAKVEEVQRMLGHTNITTTMIYAEVNTDNIKTIHDRCVL